MTRMNLAVVDILGGLEHALIVDNHNSLPRDSKYKGTTEVEHMNTHEIFTADVYESRYDFYVTRER